MEEIIEEVEEDPAGSGQSGSEAESEVPASPPMRAEIRPAAEPPRPRPFTQAVGCERAAAAEIPAPDRRSGGADAPKYVRFALAAAVFAGLCVGIFYAFKSNPYAVSIFSREGAAGRPSESGEMILGFSIGEMTGGGKKV